MFIDIAVVELANTEAESRDKNGRVSCLTTEDLQRMIPQPEIDDHTDLPLTIADDTYGLRGYEVVLDV